MSHTSIATADSRFYHRLAPFRVHFRCGRAAFRIACRDSCLVLKRRRRHFGFQPSTERGVNALPFQECSLHMFPGAALHWLMNTSRRAQCEQRQRNPWDPSSRNTSQPCSGFDGKHGGERPGAGKLHKNKTERDTPGTQVARDLRHLAQTKSLAGHTGSRLRVNAFQLFQQVLPSRARRSSGSVGLAAIWDQWKNHDLALQYAHRALLAPGSLQRWRSSSRLSAPR